jgi:hypothetical protein
MTKQTKLELVQINTRLAAENEALRKQVADLQHTASMRAAPAIRTLSPEAEAIITSGIRAPQWQQDRAKAMAAAREAAMRTRMIIKV